MSLLTESTLTPQIMCMQGHEEIFIQLLEDSVQQNGYITKHGEGVSCVAYSPKDNNLVASAGKGRKIKLVSRSTGTVKKVWNAGRVISVTFSPAEGKTIAAGFQDGNIMVFDVETGKDVCTLTGHEGAVPSVAFSPDGKFLASGSNDETVRIWDVATARKAMAPLIGHSKSVNSVAFSPDGKFVASGSDDMTVRIWDAKRGIKVMQSKMGHTSHITAVAFSPDSKW
jgi:WD40 repeat protein